MQPETIMEYYLSVVSVVGSLAILLGVKYTLRRWRSLPNVPWLVSSFAMGLLVILVASLLELPFFFISLAAVALAAGLFEELAKLLPLLLFRQRSPHEKWKLIVGTGFVVGSIEGVLYTIAVFALGQYVYLALVRVLLIGLHTVFAAISAGFIVYGRGRERFTGPLFSILAHTFYDLPPLAFLSGYSPEFLLPSAVLASVFLLAVPFFARKASEMVEVPTEEEEKFQEVTSSP